MWLRNNVWPDKAYSMSLPCVTRWHLRRHSIAGNDKLQNHMQANTCTSRSSPFILTFSGQALLAAMLEGKAVIGETDMPKSMQQDALRLAGQALDEFDVTESTEIASIIKKEFDRLYGSGWQCIVGRDFGSFVTHHSGCFIHFYVGSLAILLFKGAVVAPEADTGG